MIMFSPLYPQKKPTRKGRDKRLSRAPGPPRLRRQIEKELRDATNALQAEASYIAMRPDLSPAQKAEALNQLMAAASERFNALGDRLAATMVSATDAAGRRHYTEQLRRAMGVDVSVIFDTPAMRQTLETAAFGASSLIKTIPQDQIGRVTQALIASLQQKPMPGGGSLVDEIHRIGGISRRRAVFIARDQYHKVKSDIDQAQQEEIGVEEYIWRNSRDQRVVGNPSGLYPEGNKMHGDHWSREGKKFRWDKAPHDGHPGKAPGCRCYAEAVLNVERILKLARAA